MTSKIIVNNIEADTGISSITANSNIVRGSTLLHNNGITVGTNSFHSTGITADELTITTNSVERIRVGAAGSIGIGTDNPQKLIDMSGVHSGINTTGRFVMNPHSSGWDTGVTSGNIHHHYIDNFRLYSGQIGSGTERFKVDSNGYMTVPYQPAFRASHNTSTTYTSAQRLPYRTDHAGNFGCFDKTNSYDNSNYYFVAPVAGTYIFGAGTYTNANQDAMWDIRVNGTIVQRAEWRQTSGDDIGDNSIHHITVIVQLAVNDQVDVYWSAGQVELIQNYTSFHGAKIS